MSDNVEDVKTTEVVETKKTEEAKSANTEKEVFSREYVHELREENKSWRLRHSEAEKKAKEVEEQYSGKLKEFENNLTQKEKAANERIIRAELKVHAIANGIIDLDALKLIDTNNIKITENGDVEGAKEAIEQLKTSKEYLFKETKSSTYTGKDAKPKGEAKKTSASAFEMSNDDYQKAKKTKAWLSKAA